MEKAQQNILQKLLNTKSLKPKHLLGNIERRRRKSAISAKLNSADIYKKHFMLPKIKSE